MRMKHMWEVSSVSKVTILYDCDSFAQRFCTQLLVQILQMSSGCGVAYHQPPYLMFPLSKINMPSMLVAHNSLMQYPHLRYFHLLHITGIAEHHVFNLPKCVNIIATVAVYRFSTVWTHQCQLNIGYKCIGVLQMMGFLYTLCNLAIRQNMLLKKPNKYTP